MWSFEKNKNDTIRFEDTTCFWRESRWKWFTANVYLTDERFVVEQHPSPTAPPLIRLILPFTRQRVVFEVALASLKEIRLEQEGKRTGMVVESEDGTSGMVFSDRLNELYGLIPGRDTK
jgi:hypothetical protein